MTEEDIQGDEREGDEEMEGEMDEKMILGFFFSLSLSLPPPLPSAADVEASYLILQHVCGTRPHRVTL